MPSPPPSNTMLLQVSSSDAGSQLKPKSRLPGDGSLSSITTSTELRFVSPLTNKSHPLSITTHQQKKIRYIIQQNPSDKSLTAYPSFHSDNYQSSLPSFHT